MVIIEKSTELQILNAAREVFLEKGFDGTRMQEIADKAGINKALLHYYFRTKEKLFMGIFAEAIGMLVPKVIDAMREEHSFRDIVTLFVQSYYGIMKQNPQLAVFVMREIHRDPETLIGMMRNKGLNDQLVGKLIHSQVSRGVIRPVNPVQLLVSIVSMCIFPFIAGPILKGLMFNNDQTAFDAFLEERQAFVVELILKGLDYDESK